MRSSQHQKSVREIGKIRRVQRKGKVGIANKFNKLDVHDDTLLSVKIHPPRSLSKFARIIFELQDDSSGAVKVLSFRSCANVRFVMDFDVLASNWHFGNTEGSSANTNISRMRLFIEANRAHWRTKYMPPIPKNKPIRNKLESIRSYVLFRVTFFGGTVEILAKNYSIGRARPLKS